MMGLGLEPALVAALEARTEGWAAGLQLAALSARTHAGAGDGAEGVAGFVEAFSGSHRFVLDYLVEEVLDRQPDDVRELPARHLRARPAHRRPVRRADRPLRRSADAGDPRAREPVRRPARRRAPVVPLPPPLRRRVARPARPPGMPTGSAGCTRAASRWLAENGLLGDAVGTRSRAATTSTPPTSSSSRCPTCADDARTAPSATGCARCPTTSYAADRCSPRSRGGSGSPRATSTGWRRGSTPPRPASTRRRRRPSPRRARCRTAARDRDGRDPLCSRP